MHSISRRAFLKTSAALAAVPAATSASAKSLVDANERIRVAILGCRSRGNVVAAAMLNTGRFDIVTLCDCDDAMIDVAMRKLENKLSRRPKLEKDFRRVLDDKQVDAVVVATPDHWHALMTLLALDAGKHVYVEKPASYDINEGKAMVAAQKRHPNLVVEVGTQHRSGQHFKDVRQFIASGGLGKVAFCRGWLSERRVVVNKVPDSEPPSSLDYEMWVGPAPMRPYNEQKVHYNWHYMKDYGTADMGNWGIHWLDSIRHMMNLDVPHAVCATGSKVVDDAKEWPDTVTALYEYPGLAVVWELRSWTKFPLHGKATGVELTGDKGTIVIDRSGWDFFPIDGQPVKHKGSLLVPSHVVNFADCIAGTASPAAPIEQGHKSAVLCHLSNISTLVGRRLVFDKATETIKDDPEANRYLTRPWRAPWQLPA